MVRGKMEVVCLDARLRSDVCHREGWGFLLTLGIVHGSYSYVFIYFVYVLRPTN